MGINITNKNIATQSYFVSRSVYSLIITKVSRTYGLTRNSGLLIVNKVQMLFVWNGIVLSYPGLEVDCSIYNGFSLNPE